MKKILQDQARAYMALAFAMNSEYYFGIACDLMNQSKEI